MSPQFLAVEMLNGLQYGMLLLLVTVALGLMLERALIRRLRGRPPIDTLLLTFGLALALEAAIRLIWGSGSYSIEAPAELSGIVPLPIPAAYPKYRLFVIAIGVVVGALLVAFLQLTRLGLTVRGVSNDPEMVAVLGV